jgi:hypothetical protein
LNRWLNSPGVPTWVALTVEYGLPALVFTVPELLIALGGGWMTTKLGIVIERRPAALGAET